ncbi:MAG: hypothetical protein ACOX87_02230 [Chloroflexota bacterium]|jgi:hypothetical protein
MSNNPVVLSTPPPHTWLQHFRALTEGFLMMVAQEDMVRRYPNMGVKPYPKSGWIYLFLRFPFLPAYRLVPWPLRQWILRLFFIRGPQHWVDWE